MTRTSPTGPSARRAAALLALAAAAACGGSANQNARGADSASGPPADAQPVGANKPANDSAFARAQGRLDSLSAAGVQAQNGIDSVGSRVQAQTANEPIRDTSRLNNRATPGGVAADGRRP